MEVILKYFKHLTPLQRQGFEALFELYVHWNAKINVISRKDIDNLYLHHVLHSLAIARYITFKKSTRIFDVGTGGGFPGIPLAIFFPECEFTLIDSIGKKTKVGQEVINAISINNVEIKHLRIQEEVQKYDFVVSRAVMPLPDLAKLSTKNILSVGKNALPNGLICLKGGELQHEILPFKKIVSVTDISDFFEEDYFKTKKLVYLPLG